MEGSLDLIRRRATDGVFVRHGRREAIGLSQEKLSDLGGTDSCSVAVVANGR